jgi:hypothetical protein
MSNGWSPEEKVIVGGVVVPQSTTAAISQEFKLTSGASERLVIAVVASAVSGGTVDLKLQTAINDQAWSDVKSTTIAASGVAYIRLLAEASGDQSVLPLLSKGRVVAVTGAGESITVSNVFVLQPK